jgi:hypothetical protein
MIQNRKALIRGSASLLSACCSAATGAYVASKHGLPSIIVTLFIFTFINGLFAAANLITAVLPKD